jgi:hypothetical protein
MMKTTIGGNAPLPIPCCCPLEIGWPNSMLNHQVINGVAQLLLLLMLFLSFNMGDILPTKKNKKNGGGGGFVTLPSSSCFYFPHFNS